MVYVDRINKLAEYCATNGEYQAAIEYYVKLITIDSENGPAWTALGHCYLLVEDLQKSFLIMIIVIIIVNASFSKLTIHFTMTDNK